MHITNKSIIKTIAQNKYIYHKYFIEKELESGIALLGWEIKSIRAKQVTIENSYVSFHKTEAYMYNSIFQVNTNQTYYLTYDPKRARKLLLKKNELLFLMNQTKNHGYTIAILQLYWKNNWIKLKIGVAKGKKKHDKRNKINTQKWKHEKIHIINKYINK